MTVGNCGTGRPGRPICAEAVAAAQAATSNIHAVLSSLFMVLCPVRAGGNASIPAREPHSLYTRNVTHSIHGNKSVAPDV